MSRFWSNIVTKLTPYTPGEQPKLENLIKLNTNENPYPPSPKVTRAIERANNAELRKYPDPSAAALKSSIAHCYQLDDAQIFVGNSSDEVLAHVFRALLQHDQPILFPDITYSFYPVYCGLFNIEYKQIPLREDFSLQLDDYANTNGGIIFANPNAPTGLAVTPQAIKKLLQRNTDSVVVVDEAYVDFSDASVVDLVNEFPNLLVTQTLSKSRSLAGLRVGLAIANAELIEALERVKNSFHPYALDRLALAGAQAAFEDVDYFRQTCAQVIATRESVTDELKSLGFTVVPSAANFVFARHRSADAASLFANLRERGIVVRYFDTPRLRDYLRISIGTEGEMKSLVNALSEIIST